MTETEIPPTIGLPTAHTVATRSAYAKPQPHELRSFAKIAGMVSFFTNNQIKDQSDLPAQSTSITRTTGRSASDPSPSQTARTISCCPTCVHLHPALGTFESRRVQLQRRVRTPHPRPRHGPQPLLHAQNPLHRAGVHPSSPLAQLVEVREMQPMPLLAPLHLTPQTRVQQLADLALREHRVARHDQHSARNVVLDDAAQRFSGSGNDVPIGWKGRC